MRTLEDREIDGHLDLWARKAGYVFGLDVVARSFAGALKRDPQAISFLNTANEVTDLLVEIANLAPAGNGALPYDGTTQISVPNDVILTARALVMHWQRLATQTDD